MNGQHRGHTRPAGERGLVPDALDNTVDKLCRLRGSELANPSPSGAKLRPRT